jgi:cytochrome c oxidase cbb3-type subunit I/II
MWVTGIMQGLMWREVDAQGFLVNSFADTVAAKFPMYVVAGGRRDVPHRRADHGYNLWMTVTKGRGPQGRPCRGRQNKEGRRMALYGQTRRSRTRPSFWRSASWSSRSAGSWRSRRCSTSRTPSRRWRACAPTPRWSWPGRDIYIREGCYVCHSPDDPPHAGRGGALRPLLLAAESMYDHPFQWGSKRTGPDLARVGGATRTTGMSIT